MTRVPQVLALGLIMIAPGLSGLATAGSGEDWLAVAVSRAREDGTSVPAWYLLDAAALGLSREALASAGLDARPLSAVTDSDFPAALPAAEVVKGVIDSFVLAPTAGPGPITASSPIEFTVYHDGALTRTGSGESAALQAWTDIAGLFTTDAAIHLHRAFLMRGEGGVDDVNSICGMQMLAAFEERFLSPSRAIMIFSPGKVWVDGKGDRFGVASDHPMSRPFRAGGSTDKCTLTERPLPFIPSAYVEVSATTAAVPFENTNGKMILSHLGAHEIAHLFGMQHEDGDCDQAAFNHWHRTVETATGDAIDGCPALGWDTIPNPHNHFHWDFSAVGVARMRDELDRFVACVNAGWCGDGPSWVRSTVATSGQGTVTLNWQPPVHNAGTIYTYYIYRKEGSGAYSFLNSDTASPYTDSNVIAGRTYTYYLRAYAGSYGEGPRGAEVSAAPTAPPSNSPPTKPSGSAPASGSTAQNPVVFSWSAATDPDRDLVSYTVFSKQDGASVYGSRCAASVTSCSATLSPTGVYHWWYVTATDGKGGSASSDPIRFFVAGANRQPDKPVNTAPAQGATVANPVTFRWTGGDPDGDAVTYTVRGSENGGTTRDICTAASTLTCSAALTPTGPWSWFVVASDGRLSNTGTATSFTVSGTANNNPRTPNPSAPGQNAAVNNPVTFSWSNGGDPDGDTVTYTIRGAEDGAPGGYRNLCVVTGGSSCTASLSPTSANYNWYIHAADGKGGTAASVTMRFYLNAPAPNRNPNTPTPSTPAWSATASNPVTFSWSNGGDPDGDTVTYTIRGAEDGASGYRNLCVTTSPSGCAASLSPTNAWYSWYISASDGKGGSAASETYRFYLAGSNRAPNTPTPTAPSSGGSSNNPVTFSWTNGGDPDGDTVTYTIRGAEDGAPGGYRNLCVVTGGSSCTASLSPTGAWYNWYISASDGRGGVAASETRSFFLNAGSTNRAPNTPTPTAPANGGSDAGSVTFTWTGGGDPDGDTVTYTVRGSEEGAPYRNLCTSVGTQSCTMSSGPTGWYNWYVHASDGRGGTAASVTWGFQHS